VSTQLARTALPVLAIAAFVVGVAAVVSAAGSTLGFDYLAYETGARRVIDGQRLYDPSIDAAGAFGLFYYPPPFALAVVPFALIGGTAAIWLWTIGLVVAFAVGVAILPVSRTVRWLVLLLAALDWPFLYSIKLGQVGPVLFLLFAIGWRWLDRPNRLGPAIGLGILIKVQPAILLVWAGLTGRWRAAGTAVALVVVAALLSVAVVGIQPWLDLPSILARIASPLTTAHNFTPGAIAYQAGLSIQVAGAIQTVAILAAVAAVIVAARASSAEAAYIVAVVASQLLSPLLWDHYAMILLLPVAWLLERRQWWAVLVPLATSILLVGALPVVIYPIAFAICLVTPLALGWHGRDPRPHLAGLPA